MLKKLLGLLSDAAIYGASSALSQVIGFFLLPIYTRHLSPLDYGIMAMLSIVTMVFIPLANLGITNAIFRRFSLEKVEEARGRVLTTGLYALIVSAIALFGLCMLAAEQISVAVVGDGETTRLVQLTLVASLIAAIAAIPAVTLRAERRVKTLAAVNVGKVLLSVSLTIWLVVFRQWGVAGVILANAISDLVFVLVQFAITSKYFRYRPSLQTWRSMISYGLPFVPHNLQAVGIVLFGQYMLRQMVGLEEAGLYNVATKFAVPIAFVIASIQSAWVPYKFEIHASEQDSALIFRSMLSYYMAGVSYLWVGLSLWGPELCRLMTEQQFHSAAQLVPLVAFVPVAQGMYFMLGTGIEMSDNTRSFPLVGFAGLVTVVVCSFAFVPRLQAEGAVLATAAGWLVMAGVIYALAQRRFKVPYDWPVLSSLLGLAGIIVAVGYFCQQFSFEVRMSLALAFSLLYPLFALLIFLRSAAERERMHILWRRLAQRQRRSSSASAVVDEAIDPTTDGLTEAFPLPDWAMGVLGSPTENAPLHVCGDSLAASDQGTATYAIEDKIAFLVTDARDELRQFAQRFPAYAEGAIETLRPSQRRFRRHLRKFLDGLPSDSVVVDIASGEAEFADYFAHLRYIAMDRSMARLKRAIELGRVDFGVVADIRRPPLQEGVLAAITSTNTLNHFPAEDVPRLAVNLLRFLKPDGCLACTIAASSLAAVEDALQGRARIVSVRGLDGPLARWWSRRVHGRAILLSSRMRFPAGQLVQAATATGSSLVALCDRVFDLSAARACEYLWLVVQRNPSMAVVSENNA